MSTQPKHTKGDLKQMQALPLELKIKMTKRRIEEWINYYDGNVYVSLSGKDSTVLLHLVRRIDPNIKAVFCDTGLELPEIRDFIKTVDNVDWVKPKQSFREIIIENGYPLFSKEVAECIRFARKITGGGVTQFIQETSCLESAVTSQTRTHQQKNVRRKMLQGIFLDMQEEGNKSIFNKEKYLPACQELPFLIGGQCCNKLKKQPMKAYGKKTGLVPMVGTTAEESMLRTQAWLRTGCNAYSTGKSQPLSFWLEQDILRYIKQFDVPISNAYGDIVTKGANGELYDNTLCDCGKLCTTGFARTGCMYCAFGAGNEHKKIGKSRYEILAEKHPKIFDYCMRGGKWIDNPFYDPTAPKFENDGWKNWNPKTIWVPSETGLGLKFVFEEVNSLYGKDFIKY